MPLQAIKMYKQIILRIQVNIQIQDFDTLWHSLFSFYEKKSTNEW